MNISRKCKFVYKSQITQKCKHKKNSRCIKKNCTLLPKLKLINTKKLPKIPINDYKYFQIKRNQITQKNVNTKKMSLYFRKKNEQMSISQKYKFIRANKNKKQSLHSKKKARTSEYFNKMQIHLL